MSNAPWARVRHADGSSTDCQVTIAEPGGWSIGSEPAGAAPLVMVHEPACGLGAGDVLEHELGGGALMWVARERQTA